jgi:hypothetical protein
MKKGADNQPVTHALLKSTLNSTLMQAFADFSRTFGREMRDFVRQEIGASETRVKKEILEGVAEIIDHGIHPQLDNHEQRLLKLETKTQH